MPVKLPDNTALVYDFLPQYGTDLPVLTIVVSEEAWKAMRKGGVHHLKVEGERSLVVTVRRARNHITAKQTIENMNKVRFASGVRSAETRVDPAGHVTFG